MNSCVCHRGGDPGGGGGGGSRGSSSEEEGEVDPRDDVTMRRRMRLRRLGLEREEMLRKEMEEVFKKCSLLSFCLLGLSCG